MGKPRDSRRDSEYWSFLKLNLADRRSFTGLVERYQDAQSRDVDMSECFFIEGFMFNMEAVSYCYSAGDDLNEIYENAILIALKSIFYVLEEAEKGNTKLPIRYVLHPATNSFALHNIYCVLCWLVCFGVDHEDMERFTPYFVAEGQDRFTDIILRQYQPDRAIAKGSAAEQAFGLINKLLDVGADERSQIILTHLDNWVSHMRLIKRSRGLGGASHAVLAVSNEDLDKSEVLHGTSDVGRGYGGYNGWWAWEVALAVKVLGIDDSAFAEHVLYPKEMVRFVRTVESHNPWPIGWSEQFLDEQVEKQKTRKVSAPVNGGRELSQIFQKLDTLEQEFASGQKASNNQLIFLEDLCKELRVRCDAEAWVPRLLSLIENTSESVDIDFSWAITHALESTWPVYIEELFRSIERQPRGISLCIADRAFRGVGHLPMKWQSLLKRVVEDPNSTIDACEVAGMILDGQVKD